MRGEVAWLYAFDVADEIDVTGLETLLDERATRLTVTGDRAGPRDVPVYRPLTTTLAATEPLSEGRAARVRVKVFDVGVITIEMRTTFECGSLDQLHSAHQPQCASSEKLETAAHRYCERLIAELKPRLRRHSDPPVAEAYTVFCLNHLGEASDLDAWIESHRASIAGLLTETAAATLSEQQIAETLRIRRSFARTDAAIIDWDAALLVDLAGPIDDALYVLELANLQWEEFRVLDRRLDGHLDRTYAALERRPRMIFGQHVRTLRTLRRLRLDVSKLADEVRHITKFLGDWHLARVYDGARERFYLDQWQASVEDRLHALDDLHREIRDEASERRMLWLEVAIVVLFVIDIVALFWGK
jgi:hypothetical protein